MALIDDMLAAQQSKLDEVEASYTPEPTTAYDNKVASLDGKYAEKKQVVEPAMIKYQEDADSVRYSDENEDMRFKGFDSYEVPHYIDPAKAKSPEDYQDNLRGQERRLDRQRGRYASQFGRDEEEVTNQDIYREGMRENLQALYNKTKSPTDRDRNGILRGEPGYQDWTPGPIADAWIPEATEKNPNPSQLGSEENPLDIAVNRRYQRDAQGNPVVGK